MGETTLYGAGNLRVAVSAEDGVSVAASFTTELTQAVPCGDGWVFASDDGALAHANEFLGELHWLGDFEPYAPLRGGSRAMVVSNERLFSVRCGQEVDLVEESLRYVLDARARGAETYGLTRFGAFRRDETQSSSWQPLDLGEHIGTSFLGEAALETSGGSLPIEWLAPPLEGFEPFIPSSRAYADERVVGEALSGRTHPAVHRHLGPNVFASCTRDEGLVVRFTNESSVEVPNTAGCRFVEGEQAAIHVNDAVLAVHIDESFERVDLELLGSFSGRGSLSLFAGNRLLVSPSWGDEVCDARLCFVDLATGRIKPLPASNTGRVQVAGHDALFEGEDAWNLIDSEANIRAIASDLPASDELLLSRGEVWHVVRADDETAAVGGASGTITRVQPLVGTGAPLLLPENSLFFAVANDAMYVAGSSSETIQRSDDSGVTWSPVASDPRLVGRMQLVSIGDVEPFRGYASYCPQGLCRFGPMYISDVPPVDRNRLIGRRSFPDPPLSISAHSRPQPVRCERGTIANGEPGPSGVFSPVEASSDRVRWRGTNGTSSFVGESRLASPYQGCTPLALTESGGAVACRRPSGGNSMQSPGQARPTFDLVQVRPGRPAVLLAEDVGRPNESTRGALVVDHTTGMVRMGSLVVWWTGDGVHRRRISAPERLALAWISGRPALLVDDEREDWLGSSDVIFLDDGVTARLDFGDDIAPCVPSDLAPDAVVLRSGQRLATLASRVQIRHAIVHRYGQEFCLHAVTQNGLVSPIHGDHFELPLSLEAPARDVRYRAVRRGSSRALLAHIPSRTGDQFDCPWIPPGGLRFPLEVRVDENARVSIASDEVPSTIERSRAALCIAQDLEVEIQASLTARVATPARARVQARVAPREPTPVQALECVTSSLDIRSQRSRR